MSFVSDNNMKKSKIRSKKFIIISLLCILAMFIQNVSAYADEDEVISSEESDEDAANDETSETAGADESEASGETNEDATLDSNEEKVISEILPTEKTRIDVVSVDLPTVNDDGDSPFDFIVDPQYLIYDTDAALYGGGKVEEGAALLFRNHEGEYDFSGKSDSLTIKNRSNINVKVVIRASIGDLGEVGLSDSSDFGGNESCELYLAFVDDEGNEIPLKVDEEVTIEIEMDKAPENTYTFSYDEESETLQYTLFNESESIEFDTYSFGLKGACNVNADWEDVSVHPALNITWSVEPILSEEEDINRAEVSETTKPDDVEADAKEANSEEGLDEDDNSDKSDAVIDNETGDAVDGSESTSSNGEPESGTDNEDPENTDSSENISEIDSTEENNTTE